MGAVTRRKQQDLSLRPQTPCGQCPKTNGLEVEKSVVHQRLETEFTKADRLMLAAKQAETPIIIQLILEHDCV